MSTFFQIIKYYLINTIYITKYKKNDISSFLNYIVNIKNIYFVKKINT